MEKAQSFENIFNGFRKVGMYPSLTFDEWRAGPGKDVKFIDQERKGTKRRIDVLTTPVPDKRRRFSLNLATPPGHQICKNVLKK